MWSYPQRLSRAALFLTGSFTLLAAQERKSGLSLTGQTSGRVHYLARTAEGLVFFTDDRIVLSQRDALRAAWAPEWVPGAKRRGNRQFAPARRPATALVATRGVGFRMCRRMRV